MENAALKLELLDWLMHLEDENKIKQVLSIKNSEEIVAYSARGVALTQKEYISEIEKGLNDVKLGNVRPQSEIRKKYSDE